MKVPMLRDCMRSGELDEVTRFGPRLDFVRVAERPATPQQQMQTAAASAYSTFLHEQQNEDPSDVRGSGNFNDNDDQADSGSALEDSPRDGDQEDDDDEDYDPTHEDEDGRNEQPTYGGPLVQQQGVVTTGVSGPGLNRHPSSSYRLAYPAPALISQYFYTPPSQNPYSVTGGQGQFYPGVVAQNPVAVAIPLNVNGEPLPVQAPPPAAPNAPFVGPGILYPVVSTKLAVIVFSVLMFLRLA